MASGDKTTVYDMVKVRAKLTGSGFTADKVDGKDADAFASTDLSNVDDSSILTKLKNVDGAGSGLDADLIKGKLPLYREPDFDSGWVSSLTKGEAIMFNHGFGAIPVNIQLIARNDDTNSIRLISTIDIIYNKDYGYYGLAVTRITDNNISVYVGSHQILGSQHLMRYDGTTDEDDTDNVSIKLLCWK